MSVDVERREAELISVPEDLAALNARRQPWRGLKSRTTVCGVGALRAMAGQHANSGVAILMYHRVTPWESGLSEPTWNVPPECFRAQLEGLLREGLTPQPLRTLLMNQHAHRRLAPRSFVVTFDDGYENVYRYAFPILQQLKIPATVFLATAYIDRPDPFPFDDWAAKGNPEAAFAWRPLSWDQCREMQASGWIDFGTHTHTHSDFRNRPALLADELRRSCLLLEERLGEVQPMFAFPYGSRKQGFADDALIDAARQAGVCCALTTEHELADPAQDGFGWGRITAHRHDTAATLAARSDPWYFAARARWRQLRRFLRQERTAHVR
jgi:peptidoglycan/xylan/chitin deacetylase (PgdA/CDA1 family)